MEMSNFGVLAMIAFLASAVGGIVLAISWAKSRSHNPAPREQILNSLKQRLERGEISQQDYDQRIAQLDTRRSSK